MSETLFFLLSCHSLEMRRHLLEDWVRPNCFSHFDSFLFDLIFLLCCVFLQSIPLSLPRSPLSFLLQFSLCVSIAVHWVNNSQPPAGRELLLSHTRSVILSLLFGLLEGIFLHENFCLCFNLWLFSLCSLWEYHHAVTCLSFLRSPHPPLCFSLVLWQVAVRLCKLNSGKWAVAHHHTAALK